MSTASAEINDLQVTYIVCNYSNVAYFRQVGDKKIKMTSYRLFALPIHDLFEAVEYEHN